jgi:uncharacterized protein (TIGR00369 family)
VEDAREEVVEPRPPRRGWGDDGFEGPHVWKTLGFRRVDVEPGKVVLEWDAPTDYSFPDGSGGRIVHGGLVSTILDSAMGGACWSLLDEHEHFLTADLRVEFMRAARPGTLRAEGKVVQRTRRVAFCSAELYDEDGTQLANARCTQVIRS